MSTDLDTRLRALTELSPPSHERLGTEELHRRASRRRQRTTAARAIPAIVVVVAVLAGAFALANRTSTTDVVVGPEVTELPDATTISERDLQMLDFLRSAAELSHQLQREMVLSVVYTSTATDRGREELHAQRAATDVALRAYQDQLETVVPSGGTIAVDEVALGESITQAANRLERLEVNRRSVDSVQTDALGQIDPYASTIAALQDLPVRYLQGVEDPDVFRGVLTASNLGNYSRTKAESAATLTIAVEIGFYASILPKGSDPLVAKGECGEDADAAGRECPVFADALRRSVDGDKLEATFLNFATTEQKQMYRPAGGNSDFDQMVADAFEGGIGANTLRGSTLPPRVAIVPEVWQTATLDQIDHLAEVEQQLYDQVR